MHIAIVLVITLGLLVDLGKEIKNKIKHIINLY